MDFMYIVLSCSASSWKVAHYGTTSNGKLSNWEKTAKGWTKGAVMNCYDLDITAYFDTTMINEEDKCTSSLLFVKKTRNLTH